MPTNGHWGHLFLRGSKTRDRDKGASRRSSRIRQRLGVEGLESRCLMSATPTIREFSIDFVIPPPSATPPGSRPGPTAASGSPTNKATGSAGSIRQARSPSSPPASRPAAHRSGSRPGPTATSGSPRARQRDRPDHPRGRGHRVPRHHARQRARRDHGRARRQPLVHRGTRREIGRITPTGAVTEFAGITTAAARRDHGRARRQPLVHRVAATRSAGSRPRAWSPSSSGPHRRRQPRVSRPGPTATSGSPRSATGSAGSPPAGASPSSPRAPRQQHTHRHHGRARRQPLVHRRSAADRPDHHGRRRHRVPAGLTAGSDPDEHHRRARRQPLVHRVGTHRSVRSACI